VLVVDASVIAPAVADGGRDGDTCRARLRGETLAAPDLLRLETMSVLRRQLLRRGWELRDNATAYDSCYAALAEALDCPLLTADKRLANAPGVRCSFEVL